MQACFQQIQTVYKLKKPPKNSTADEAAQLTTTVRYQEHADDVLYDDSHQQFGLFRDYQQTTAVTRNLTGIADEAWERSLEYTDGINVLGQYGCVVQDFR